MTFVIESNEQRVIGPEECLALAGQHIDPDEPESFVENAWILKALANDRTFLLANYHRRLKEYWSDIARERYQPQSIEIAKDSSFYLRANIWLPIDTSDPTSDFQKRLYAYDLPHDHNFNFLTVGYYGPGYETDIYRYDIDKTIGFVGENVKLDFVGRYQLGPGNLMFYRENTDIHIQYCPTEISVSVNMMAVRAGSDNKPQYIFDIASETLAGGAGDLLSNRLFMLSLAATFYDDNTKDILSAIAQNHICPRTRSVSWRALEKIDRNAAHEMIGRIGADAVRYAKYDLISGNFARTYSNA